MVFWLVPMGPSKRRKTKITCQIDDNEARAVQRLVLVLKSHLKF